MNVKLRLSLLAILVFVSAISLSAQRILHKANKQFDLKHYHEAIETYKKTLDKHPNNLEAKSNLAECYRMTNQLTLAADAYANIMPEEFVDPIHIRNYGITLMKMAKYNEAHYQFELYKVYNPQDAQHYQLSCEFAHHLYRTENTFEIELVGVNTPNSDFGVAFNGDNLIFSSFRNDVELSDDAKKSGQKLTGNMLYIADMDKDLRAENVRFLRSGIAEKKNIGPISFATTARKCAFTRNKIQDGGAHVTGDDSYHSIYIADLNEDGSWVNERPFRYNEFGTSTGFPCLAFDGSALYFASNRVGGYGGYDIYVSYWKENSWTYPQNLGEAINTPGNEITPFFTDEDLYFASDYHHGMGGYDIFHSLVKGGSWTHPENMASGINSPADDYYPVIKKGKEGIFFSSNRLGGRGMDDIYLGIQREYGDELVSLDKVPEAVALTTMNSKIEEVISSNDMARAVSNKEELEVKVLNPTLVENIPNDKSEEEVINYETVMKEEAKLETWGFAKPEEAAAKQRDPRKKLSIETISNIKIASLSSLNPGHNVVEMPTISISYAGGGSILENYINAPEEMDNTVEEVATVDEEVDTVNKEEVSADDVMAATSAVEVTTVVEETQIDSEEENYKVELDEPAIVDMEIAPETYKIPNYEEVSVKKAPLNLDLAGAKRVALGEILPTSNVYFIQLAALSKTSGNVNQFKSLAKYGNLYKVFKASTTKIKLGYFLDKTEASIVLRDVKARGYKDAFITKDDLSALQLELIVANDNQKSTYKSYDAPGTAKKKTETYYDDEYTLHNTARNSYKIRLASYEDPIWFDIEKAKQLGEIEQWTKGNWTIFLLGGYNTYEAAEAARIKAVNRGFTDAEIVIDNNGILQRLKQN
ncbi:MAG: tetratricopeptide repeat protein [Bacteroidota bacterium]